MHATQVGEALERECEKEKEEKNSLVVNVNECLLFLFLCTNNFSPCKNRGNLVAGNDKNTVSKKLLGFSLEHKKTGVRQTTFKNAF